MERLRVSKRDLILYIKKVLKNNINEYNESMRYRRTEP